MIAIFFEAAPHEFFERRRDIRIQLDQLLRLFLQNRAERFDRRIALERARAAQHLVHNRAEREDVRSPIDQLAAHLLRRHVADRAEDDAGLGGRHLERRSIFAGDRAQLRDAEVEDLHAPFFGDVDVLGLQIAVHDPFFVRRRESMRDLQRDVDGFARRNRSAIEAFAERFTFQQLADEKRGAVGVADVVDRQQIRMIEHACGARFLLESLQTLLVAERHRGQNFDGHIAAEASVGGAINRAHTPLADPSGNPVRPEHRVFLENHSVNGNRGGVLAPCGGSPPRVDVDVRPGTQLGRPLVDLLLQPRRLQGGSDVFLHVRQRWNGESPLAALLAPGASIVSVDLIRSDHDHRREALLDIALDLQLPFDEGADLVERELGVLDGCIEIRWCRESIPNLQQPRLDRILRDVGGTEALDVAKPERLGDQIVENRAAVVVVALSGSPRKKADFGHLCDLADREHLAIDQSGDTVECGGGERRAGGGEQESDPESSHF